MVKNESVRKLRSLKGISLGFIVLGAFAFFITMLIATINAPKEEAVSGILSIIFGLAAFVIIGVIVNTAFEYQINRRQENIDYMNARLEYLHNKKNNKKEIK